ncbi:MAG: TIM barrel protein, partial [Verrucomicrobiota bacterium]
TESVLRTAAELGIKRFRMGYFKYDLAAPIPAQIAEFKAQIKDLVAMTDELGIKPIYQNHSGKNYFGGPLWDLAEALDDFQPEQIGVAFDIGHATVEGAKAWPLNLARVKPWVDTVYVKEPKWSENKLGWGNLGEGVVDKGFFSMLKKSDFDGPISLHIEFLGRDPKDEKKILNAMGTNIKTLKDYLG